MPNLKLMQELHDVLTEALIAGLQSEDPFVRLKAAAEAIKFLKDNGINVDLEKTPKGDTMLTALPFVGEEEDERALG